MPVFWNVQLLNQNAQRSYPIVDWADKQDVTASLTLPDSFLVGLQFPIHAGQAVEPQKFFVKSVGLYSIGYTLELGYDDGTSDPPTVAVATVPRASHTENRSYALAGVDDFSESVGRVVIGDLAAMDLLPPGQYNFAYASTALELDCIRLQLRGVSSISVISATGDRSARIYGNVELVAGENMQLSIASTAGQTQIVFSAIDGAGLNDVCACTDLEVDAVPITTINGVPPTADGNFSIIGNDCLTVETLAHGVQLVDICSQPCCGCEELDALVSQIDRFADGVVTLQNFVERLSAEVEEMSQVVLGSRLGDQGCVGDCV